MLEVFGMLVVCSALAYMYEKSCMHDYYENNGKIEIYRTPNPSSDIYFLIVTVIMVVFAGTRTVMNDTVNYILQFAEVSNDLSEIKNINYSIGSNPLFEVYRIVIKSLISESPYVFILITSLLVVSSYMLFLKKYAYDFGYSVFLLIAFTVYAFSMAAIKQTMATAIAIWMIPEILNGRKLKALFLLLIAILIHPYIVVYLAAFVFYKGLWDKKTVLLLLATIITVAFFTTFITIVLSWTASIGDEYDAQWFVGNGVSTYRLIFYLIIPVLSFYYRKRLREYATGYTILFVNLSVISSCFIVLASFGGANMFGRMANYMDIFQCLAFPEVLYYGFVYICMWIYSFLLYVL